MPRIYVIGGPNGAGKTTTALKLLPQGLHCPEFVNADAIAAGLSPFRPDSVALQAGRLMLTRIHQLAHDRKDFAFETTLAARCFVPFLRACRLAGYETYVLYLWLSGPELAMKRVAMRVRDGGHDVPSTVVLRRYASGLRNLIHHYIPIVDAWTVYDNSDSTPRRVAHQGFGGRAIIEDIRTWDAIMGRSE